MERDTAAAKARLHDKLREFDVPSELLNSPPVVTWRHAGCRARLLRLYATPRGYLLLSDSTRVTLPEWITRTGIPHTVEDFRAGEVAAFDKRKVAGHERVLPLDTGLWPRGLFELGCSKHGMAKYDLSELSEDVASYRTTRRHVVRHVSPAT